VKCARTPEVLRALNSGFRSPGAVGKAVTVHPAPGTMLKQARAFVAEDDRDQDARDQDARRRLT
jgi:hypothetical protein